MSNVLPAPKSDPFNQKVVADKILQACTPKKGALTQQEQDDIQGIVSEAFTALVSEIQKRDLAIQRLATINKELIQKIDRITQEHELLTRRLESEKTEMGDLTATIEDLKRKDLLSEARYKELLEKTESLKRETSELQSKSKDLKGQYDLLNAENTALNAKSKELETQTSKLSDNCTQLEGQNKDLLANSDKLKSDYSQLERKYGQLENETASWSVRYNQLNENYAAMQKIVDEALKKKEESAFMNTFYKVADFCERHRYLSCFAWPEIIFEKIGL